METQRKKKVLRTSALVSAALGLFFYLFAPVIKNGNGATLSGMLNMGFVTILFAFAGVVIAWLAKDSKKDVAMWITAAIFLLTAIFCFCTEEFAEDEFGGYAELSWGAVLGGICFLLSSIGLALSALVEYLAVREKTDAETARLSQLEAFYGLRESGALTQEEFELLKKSYLGTDEAQAETAYTVAEGKTIAKRLEKLFEMFEKGVITREEFDAKKKELLD